MVVMAFKHFSTVEYIQNLRKANFTELQAEALAKEAEQLLLMFLSRLGTKLRKLLIIKS